MKLMKFIGKGVLVLTIYSLITVCLMEASNYLHEIEESNYNTNVAYNFDK